MTAKTVKKATQTLLDTIDTGWDDTTLVDQIAGAADELDLCPSDIETLKLHAEGPAFRGNRVLAVLRKIAA